MRFAEFLQCFKDCRTTDDDDSMRLRLRRDGQGGSQPARAGQGTAALKEGRGQSGNLNQEQKSTTVLSSISAVAAAGFLLGGRARSKTEALLLCRQRASEGGARGRKKGDQLTRSLCLALQDPEFLGGQEPQRGQREIASVRKSLGQCQRKENRTWRLNCSRASVGGLGTSRRLGL